MLSHWFKPAVLDSHSHFRDVDAGTQTDFRDGHTGMALRFHSWELESHTSALYCRIILRNRCPGISELVIWKPGAAEIHLWSCKGTGCQRVKPTQRKTGNRMERDNFLRTYFETLDPAMPEYIPSTWASEFPFYVNQSELSVCHLHLRGSGQYCPLTTGNYHHLCLGYCLMRPRSLEGRDWFKAIIVSMCDSNHAW